VIRKVWSIAVSMDARRSVSVRARERICEPHRAAMS
jgi:hypothetical protein